MFNMKRGPAKSFLKTTPSSISVAIICVKLRTKAPSSLSANGRFPFFLKRKAYQDESRKRLIMIYADILT